MSIADYLSDIEFAADNVISTIWSERNRINELRAEIGRLGVAVEDTYQRAVALQESDDSDDMMLGVGVYWDNYFGDDKKMFHKNEETQRLENQLASHEFSISSLSGSLLQYATQGISIAHGDLQNCPDGRMVGRQSLSEIIWQARNQALHWEEGTFHHRVEQCFRTLARDIDPKFNGYRNRSMAFDVVELLEWKDFNSFKADVLSLQ